MLDKHIPFSASWQKQASRTTALTAAEVREKTPTDASLVCPIDNKLFRDAVKTPCCGTLYCEECIQTYLLERDFLCPNCAKKVPSLDKLIVDKPTRTKVADYIEKAIEESRKESEEEAPSKTATATNTGEVCPEHTVKFPRLLPKSPLSRIHQKAKTSIPISNQVSTWTCPKSLRVYLNCRLRYRRYL
jgi:hypothetical protein